MSDPQDTTPNHELVELLDRVIDKGVVVSGDLRLSVAGIELIYINLRALIASSDRVIEEDALTATEQFPKDNQKPNANGDTSGSDTETI